MQKLIRILLLITIPTTKDDWSIEGLCLLRESRAALKDDEGNKLFQVRARNRESNAEGNDGILSCLGDAIFD
jgi:hypothetical protein